jgi:hypothetical protein
MDQDGRLAYRQLTKPFELEQVKSSLVISKFAESLFAWVQQQAGQRKPPRRREAALAEPRNCSIGFGCVKKISLNLASSVRIT